MSDMFDRELPQLELRATALRAQEREIETMKMGRGACVFFSAAAAALY
jgi:hypothetical protein